MRAFSLILFLVVMHQLATAQTNLTGHAAALYQQAQTGKWFADVAKLQPEIIPTSDDQSFLVVWRATDTNAPKHWIVTLHGSHGFATDDLAVWSRHLKGRDVGLICVQWWLGSGDTTDSYYTPQQINREIDRVLKKIGAQTNSVMLHGFSRGAANSYAVAAIDAGRGRHWFSLAVASSGGVGLNYPPTRAILDGAYGEHPLQGTRWITAAGARDPNPDRDGIPGMRRAAAWLKEQGAIVELSIEDPAEGHGALVLNPANVRRVLDLFLQKISKNEGAHVAGKS